MYIKLSKGKGKRQHFTENVHTPLTVQRFAPTMMYYQNITPQQQCMVSCFDFIGTISYHGLTVVSKLKDILNTRTMCWRGFSWTVQKQRKNATVDSQSWPG